MSVEKSKCVGKVESEEALEEDYKLICEENKVTRKDENVESSESEEYEEESMDEGYGFYCSDPRGARVYDPLNQCYIDYQAHMEYELQRYHWNSRNRCFYPPCGCCENRWCQHHRQQVENRRTAQAVGSLIEVTT